MITNRSLNLLTRHAKSILINQSDLKIEKKYFELHVVVLTLRNIPNRRRKTSACGSLYNMFARVRIALIILTTSNLTSA